MLIGVASLIGRRGVLATIGEIDVTGIDRGEFPDHRDLSCRLAGGVDVQRQSGAVSSTVEGGSIVCHAAAIAPPQTLA
jgi:hypothetical protein